MSNPRFLLRSSVCALALMAALLAPGAWAQTASAPISMAAPSLEVSQAWVRATPPGAAVAAGYLKLRNTGPAPLRLQSFRSPIAGGVQLHEMRMEGGLAKMRALADSYKLAAGAELVLEPGGYHLMFMDLRQPLLVGAAVPLILVLADGREISLSLPVRDAAPEPAVQVHEHH